jgi:HEAT repeat protein
MMIAKWFHKTSGRRWLTALTHVMFWLTICLLIGTLLPTAVAARDKGGVTPTANPLTATNPIVTAATYRYMGQSNGTTAVQRSPDGGVTWQAAGMIPEPVAQLAVNLAHDTEVVARTNASLWRSADSGVNWTRLDTLPGRPLALAISGNGEPSGRIFAGTATQGLYSSLDGGATWQAAGGPLSARGAGALAVSALAVNPSDPQVVYAAATFTLSTPEGQHRVQSVLVSVDDGRRWFEMTPAPRFTSSITQLTPHNGSSLAVWLMGPFDTQMVNLAVTPALISGLEDADAAIRAATAQALGLSQDRTLLPVLMRHLRDADPLAGDAVAQAIGRLGDPAAVPLLMLALSDSDEVIRARAATALGLLKARVAIPQLDAMLQRDGPLARRAAAEGLAAIGTPAAIAALARPLRDVEMTPVRYMAMHGLEMAGQGAIMPLRLALMDNNPVVRRNAAEMLGWLGAADAVPDLVQSLSDQDAAVRAQANWALGEIHTAPAQLALRQLANGEVGRPILQTTGDAAPRVSARPSAAVVPSLWSNALALAAASRWQLASFASLLALAILVFLLIGKGPRQHFRPS